MSAQFGFIFIWVVFAEGVGLSLIHKVGRAAGEGNKSKSVGNKFVIVILGSTFGISGTP